MKIDQFIDDAMESINSPGADTEAHIRMALLIMYAKGVGAAMRATGNWPDPDDKPLKNLIGVES